MKLVLMILFFSLLFLSMSQALFVMPGQTQSWTIQGAINAASPGDTIIVPEGTYNEGQIDVTKPLTLIANGSVIVDGLQKGHVFYVIGDNVTIEGFKVVNSKSGWGYSGIRLQNVKNCVVSRNVVTNNTNGIGVGGSGYNVIRENNATNNLYGVGLYGARYTVIEGNTLRNNLHGIRLYSSTENTVQGNVAIDNGLLPGQLGIGIYLERSSRNLIERNMVRDNRWTGILVYPDSDGNVVRKNNVSHSYNGIYLYWADDNLIYENAINLTSWAGLKLRPGCRNNTFIDNTVRNMSGTGPGIFIQLSNSNVLAGNLISNVPQWVYSSNAFENMLYHNIFINAYTPYGIPKIRIINSTIAWDNGYPSGGNYWSDHESPDDYSGPYQDEAEGDGIADIPYVINEDNRDRYPLTEPWEEPAMIRFLVRTIRLWNLPRGIEKSLTSKLDDSVHLLNIGNGHGAIRKLTDFIDYVETSRDKRLTEEQANYLILEAQKIIDLIRR